MPSISFGQKRIECEHGANLRRVLMRHKLRLYNGIARQIHCRGLGTCGTCALKIDGPVSEPTAVENWRLGFPPHQRGSGLRLACQCNVLGDLKLTKFPGMWGSRVGRSSSACADGINTS